MSNDKPPRLNVVDLGQESDASKVQGLIEAEKRMMPHRLATFLLLAEQRFAQFQEYQKAGFNDTQALRLIIADIQRPPN